MKLNIKTNDEGKIIESCVASLEDASAITVTTEQYEKIQLQYDTIVIDGKITSQTKGDDAVNLEISVAQTEAKRIEDQELNQ